MVVDRCCNGTTTLMWSSKMQHGMAGMKLIWYEFQLQILDHFVHKKFLQPLMSMRLKRDVVNMLVLVFCVVN